MIGVFEIETSKEEEDKERIISSMLGKSFNGTLVIRTYGAHEFTLNDSFDYYNVLRLLALVLRRR